MGRLGVRLLLSAALLSLVASSTPAQAKPSCVSYLVIAPVVGTIQGVRCVPLGSQFDFPISLSNCRWIPPIATTICIGVDLNLFLP